MTYAWDKTIVTAPADEGRILEGVEKIRPGVRILSSRFVPEGTAYIIGDEAFDAILRQPWEFEPIEFDHRTVLKITDIAAS